MEMPTHCVRCTEIFDLNDGHPSEKWHLNVIICDGCHDDEVLEMEEDERWETINYDIGDALYETKEDGAWDKITDENKELILNAIPAEIKLLAFKQWCRKNTTGALYDGISLAIENFTKSLTEEKVL